MITEPGSAAFVSWISLVRIAYCWSVVPCGSLNIGPSVHVGVSAAAVPTDAVAWIPAAEKTVAMATACLAPLTGFTAR